MTPPVKKGDIIFAKPAGIGKQGDMVVKYDGFAIVIKNRPIDNPLWEQYRVRVDFCQATVGFGTVLEMVIDDDPAKE